MNTAAINQFANCLECEGQFNPTLLRATVKGALVCAECATAYYVACDVCAQLFPQDEALQRADDETVCRACLDERRREAPIDAASVEDLIAEYVILHAEEKRVKDRLEEVKEKLKEHAAARERVSGAVMLRAGDAAIKCSYRTSLKCENEIVAQLTEMLAAEDFDSIFERKIAYTPQKENVQTFLNRHDEATAEARRILRGAVRETETVMLTIERKRTK